ncbi:hypothetical protein ADL05_21795 [Nocardiopsis sp. NRRL B-16309]|nr:hypothetical protein ADL05_21795 [Nocardiopsis sp. NRRL B-16309]
MLIRDTEGVPLVLLEIAWKQNHCGVWTFADDGGRNARHRYARGDDGRLTLTRSLLRGGLFPEDDLNRGAVAAGIALADKDRGLYRYEYELANGGRVDTGPQPLHDDLAPFATRRTPAFGRWEELAAMHPGLRGTFVELRDADVAPGPGPVSAPWRPPGPLAPTGVDRLFEPGRRLVGGWSGHTGTVEVRPIGTIDLPTGRVLAYDPGSLGSAKEDDVLTVPLPPGEHPVRLSLLRPDGDDADDDHTLVMALRIDVADLVETPVASWEMALRSGQDYRELGEGEFYGVGVDGGVFGFCDAACRPHLAELFTDFDQYLRLVHGHGADGRSADPSNIREQARDTSPWSSTLHEPFGGGDLIVSRSGYGDGDYPVWIGRADDGRVAALVLDALVPDWSAKAPDPAP